jgi:hypothetical protein
MIIIYWGLTKDPELFQYDSLFNLITINNRWYHVAADELLSQKEFTYEKTQTYFNYWISGSFTSCL